VDLRSPPKKLSEIGLQLRERNGLDDRKWYWYLICSNCLGCVKFVDIVPVSKPVHFEITTGYRSSVAESSKSAEIERRPTETTITERCFETHPSNVDASNFESTREIGERVIRCVCHIIDWVYHMPLDRTCVRPGFEQRSVTAEDIKYMIERVNRSSEDIANNLWAVTEDTKFRWIEAKRRYDAIIRYHKRMGTI
jgi:hypothetical protein